MTLRSKLITGGIGAAALALVAALSLNITTAIADPAGTASAEPEVVPNETILTFEDASVAERVLASAERSDALEAEVLTDDLAGQIIVNITSETPTKAQALIGAAEALPGVSAQPNYVYTLIDGESEPIDIDAETASALSVNPLALPTNFPNDKHAKLQYSLLDLGNGTTQSGANVFEAWDLVQMQPDHAKVSVAVVDSGVNLGHEDLQEYINANLAHNAFDGGRNVTDEIGHGTGVTGVIAASANNGVGIAGVASAIDDLVSVVPVKIFADTGDTTTSVIVKGLDYLDRIVEDGTLNDLKIVNMSLGIYYEDGRPTDSAMLDVIDHLTTDHGVLVVAAGGNGDEDLHAQTIPMYPSDDELCLSVTSLTETGANSEFSDYNLDKDISAPGEMIAVPAESSNDGYVYESGTSFSAPITSGVAALMFAVDPALTPADAIQIIKATAAPLPDTSINNWGELTGSAGALDAGAALRATIERVGGVLPGTGTDTPDDLTTKGKVYRLYNSYTTEHLFTIDRNEYDSLGQAGWNREGVAWLAPTAETEGAEPVYRLYNPFNGDHLYTTDEAEYQALCDAGWNGEDVKMWGTPDGLPVYRLYNPNQLENDGAYAHLWTADETEYNYLAAIGWLQEGPAWHAIG